jgi:hypothetical protein
MTALTESDFSSNMQVERASGPWGQLNTWMAGLLLEF